MREQNRSALLRLASYYGTGAVTTFVTGAVAWTVAEAVYPGWQYPDPFVPLLGVAAVGGPIGVVIALAAWATRDTWQVHLRPMWRRWVNHRWLVAETRRVGAPRPRYECCVVPCGSRIGTIARILTSRCSKHRWPR